MKKLFNKIKEIINSTNKMKLHPKAIESISKLEPFKRYKHVIKSIADWEELWTIVDINGDLGTSTIETDNDSKRLVPFWGDEDFIKSVLVGNWKKHTPLKISLDDFEDKIANVINENDYLINVFPVNDKTGFVVNLNEFIKDLNEELEQYE